MDRHFDFFISYCGADAEWAEWIAWRLEAAGYATTLQAWDFRPGGNFVADMQTALQRARRIVAVLSADYLKSGYASAEWFTAFARDPRGERRLLMPVRVDTCAVEGLLGQIVWIDLVGLDEAEAAARLLDGVREGRRKPQSAPAFPSAAKPAFPPLDRGNPYRGLAAFDAEHREDFFGRGRYVDAVAETLSRKRVACVLGASGSGKSSLLQAGMLPMLGDAAMATALCRPRDNPFMGLARALAPWLEPGLSDRGPLWIAAEGYAARLRDDPAALVRLLSELREDGQGVVVAIDQFEELFTQTASAERSAFIDLLSRAWERSDGETRWLTSLRADFLDEALAFDPLRRMLQDATVLLGPMSEEELATAVVEPARRRGVQFEAGLPERILRDAGAGDSAGRLPLLQFALSELWLRQEGGVIRHAAYDDAARGIGGIEGALRLHAERVYAGFSGTDQARIRGLFRRLAQRGPGRSDIRRLVPRAEVEHDWDLVAELARRRLLTVSEDREHPSVEVIHEALFRAWPALAGWIEEHLDFDLWRQQLGEQVARWNAAPAPAKDDLLLRGAVLDLALARSTERPSELAPREAEFIAESAAARRRQGRRRAALVASAFAAVLAVAALAGLQWVRAEDERAVAVAAQAEAERQTDLAVARRLAGVARDVLDGTAGGVSPAAMIAVAAQARAAVPETAQLLRDALDLTPPASETAPIQWSWSDMAISADGRVQAFFREDAYRAFNDDVEPHATLHLLAEDGLATIASRREEGSSRPVFSPDGRWLVSGGAGRRLVLRDAVSGEIALDETYRFGVWPAFAPDGETLYAARTDGVIETRHAPEWGLARTLSFPIDGDRGYPLTVRVSSDGRTLLVVDRWRAAYAVPTDGGPVRTLAAFDGRRDLQADNAQEGAVSPVEPVALVLRTRGGGTLWDLADGEQRAAFQEPYYARAVAFSPDGALVATANHRGTVSLRGAADGERLHRWEHGAEVEALAFSPDSRLLASGGEDGAAAIWNVETGAAGPRPTRDGAILSLAFDPGDGTLLSGDAAGALARFDADSGRLLDERRFEGRVAAIAVAQERLAVTVQESEAESHWEDMIFLDRETGAERAQVMRNADFQAHRLSPDGARFATWDRLRDELTLWDTATGDELLTIPDVGLGEYVFSADGQRLLVKIASGPLRVVDAATGATLFELGEPGGVDAVGVRPADGMLVTQGGDKVRGWNAATGAPLWTTVSESDHTRLSGDGSRFAEKASEEAPIRVRDSATGDVVGVLPAEGWIRAISQDGARLLTAKRVIEPEANRVTANEVALWDVDRDATLRKLTLGEITRFDAIPGGLFVVQGASRGESGMDTEFAVLDARNGDRLWLESFPQSFPRQVFPVADAPGAMLLDHGDARELRDVRTGAVVWRIEGGGLRAAAAAPGGDWIAVANATSLHNQDDAILFLDPASGAELRRIEGVGPIRDLRATPDGGKLIGAVQSDRFEGLRVWRATNGTLLREIALDASPQTLVQIGQANQIAVHDFSGGLRVFDPTTGALVHRFSHEPTAYRAVHAAEADRSLTWSGGALRLWDTRTGEEIAAHVADGGVFGAAVSPDGRLVAYRAERPLRTESGAEIETAVLWTPEAEGETVSLPLEDLGDVTFDGTGRRLLLTGRDGGWLRIVDVETLRTLATLRPRRLGELGRATTTGDGSALLVRETWDYRADGRREIRYVLRAFATDDFRELARIPFGGGDFHAVPNSSEVFLRGVDGRWRAFDPWSAMADERLSGGGPGDELVAAAGSPLLLASAYRTGARVYHAATGEALQIADDARDGSELGILDAALSSDGRLAVVSLRETDWSEESPGLIVLRSAESGAELARLRVERPMWQVAFVAGGEAVLMTENQFSGVPQDRDSLTLLWRWRTGEVATLQSDNPVAGLAVSRNGARFATVEGHVDEDGVEIGARRIRLWDAAGAVLAERPLDFNAFRIAIAPDGRHLAISGWAGVRLYALPDLSEVRGFGYSGDRQTQQDHIIQNVPTMTGAPSIGFALGGDVLAMGTASGAWLYDIGSGESSFLHEGVTRGPMVLAPEGDLIALQGEGVVSVWGAASRAPISRFATPENRSLLFGGIAGRDLFGLRDGALFRIEWAPDALARRACALFAEGGWRDETRRTLGEEIGAPCPPEPSGPPGAAPIASR